MFRTEIPMATPSLNKVKRMHFHAYRKLREQYENILRSRMTDIDVAYGLRRVDIIRFGSRELDHDNLVGGCKPLVDALKRCGLIVDDSPRHVRINYEQRKSPRKEARTVVTVLP